MQQIERYGVIALLFLLVTIVVVALWDGGTTSHAGGGEVAGGPEVKTPVQPRATAKKPARTDRRATPAAQRQDRTMPRVSLSGNEEVGDRRRTGYMPKPAAAVRVNQPSAGSSPMANLNGSQPGFRAEPRQARGVVSPMRSEPSFERKVEEAKTVPVVQAKRTEPVQPATQSTVTYTVKGGDSLELIARDILGDRDLWRDIQALNGIKNPSSIREGAVLKLPSVASSSKAAVKTQVAARKVAPAAKVAAKGTYVVQKGDVLSRIAQQELGSSKRYLEIVALNPGLQADRVTTGMVLNMPKKGQAPPKKTATAGASRVKSKQSRNVVH